MSASRHFALCPPRRSAGRAASLHWPALARCALAAFMLVTMNAVASATTAPPEPDATGNYSMSDIVDVLSAQSRELEDQRRLIQAQTDQIAALKDQLDALKGGSSLATSPNTPAPSLTSGSTTNSSTMSRNCCIAALGFGS